MVRAMIVALFSVGFTIAAPIHPRDVASLTVSAPLITATTVLDPAAVAQAQVRDNTATRAFSAAQVQSNGQCLTVNANSGDNRENLIPVTIQDCDSSLGAAQQWDVITAGVHNNVPGTALFVSTLTQGCLNLDIRHPTGQQVFLFSCGGRADGSGTVTSAQLFTFANNSTTIPLLSTGQSNTCLFNNNGLLDDTSCDPSNPNSDETFIIVGGVTTSSSSVVSVAFATAVASATSSVPVVSASSTVSAPLITATTVLDPAAVAQAQVRDNTATRAFSAAQLQSNGQCLTVNANSGDDRENLIPVTIQDCDSSLGAAQQWDVITAGIHNNVPGTALFVSTLTQGCLNLDTRHAAGQQVFLFSCGGRADGSGTVTSAQLFTFANKSTTIPLLPTGQPNTCLFNNNGLLDDTSCDSSSPAANELFTIVP